MGLLDFAEDAGLSSLFEKDLKPARILQEIELHLNCTIEVNSTLIIFDEIQNCPNAITSLKYFYKEMPSAYICASGSLLGVGLNKANFPVGKVWREFLYPMSFFEFLDALEEQRLLEMITSFEPGQTMSKLIHNKIFDLLKECIIY